MWRRISAIALAVVAAVPWPPVRPRALAQSQNPCAAVTSDVATAQRTVPLTAAQKYGLFGADRRDVRDLLHLSAASAAARTRTASTAVARPAADRDDNHIAILEDTGGELIVPANPFDLANSGLRFEPRDGGYSVSRGAAEFRASLGSALTLADDDSTAQTLPFTFEFYGRRFTSLFVNADGNLTFEQPDAASTERGVQRFVSGVPRIGLFFADLDPSAGGRVYVDSAADAFTITWCAVPGFDMPEATTAQAVLRATGSIEFRYGASNVPSAIVGLSPGDAETMTALDLSSATGAQAGAIGERFSATASLDLVAAARRFYTTHRDDFDQLVFWTDAPVVSDAFAFEVSVQNAITGTGLEVFDLSSELGSAGALQSVVNMDRISKYTEAPSQRVFGEFSALGILAHETGHRWLTRIMFLDADRQISDALLGRQRAHWSFFADTDGSVMEGNDIEDLGGGVFRTRSGAENFSRLDLYAMGLVGPSDVPAWFYVEAPISTREREDSPRAGVTFNGTRRTVLIDDVIDALGPRVPAAADSPRLHRQAFVFVRRASAVSDGSDFSRLRAIREQFGSFFNRATEGRMTVRTTLTP